MIQRTLTTLACLFAFISPLLANTPKIPLPQGAIARISSPQVIVAPDQNDWTYDLGEQVTFSVTVLYDGQPLHNAEISYRIGPEKFENDPITKTLPEGTFTINAEGMKTPGFLRCEVETIIQGKTYHGLATAAFAPLSIQPTQSEPQDFDEFWKKQLNLLKEIPLGLTQTLLPEKCTDKVNVYAVRYLSLGRNGPVHFHGILTQPAKPGKYPAILRVPGAGVRPYHGQIDLAEKGAIVLEIGIHGIPVTYDEELYTDLRAGALARYFENNLDHPETYYYHRVYLGCVRGNDVLTTHPMWDNENLVVIGGSQGGQLSIVTSALDNRVTGTVCNFPAYCDVTGYLHNRAGGWPHIFQDDTHRTSPKIATSAYYDAVNFAKRLHAPISMAFGFNDVTCPPTSMFAAYNVIPAEKELHLQLDMGHRASSEFNERYIQRALNLSGIK